jgi:hypothetical protein
MPAWHDTGIILLKFTSGDEDDNFARIPRMASSRMLCRVALVRTDVSEELSASFVRVTRIGELGINASCN